MSLFDKLKDTDLKSLKFGQKGTKGDSTKPYIVTDINTADTAFNKFRLTKFDDGLIRGGAVGSLNAGITDTIRITKFLADAPRGPLFIAKQVGLQLANPKLETKQLPANTFDNNTILGKVLNFGANVVNKLNDTLGGPTRIYNLGINTLAQVPVNALGGHIVRHGFLPIIDVDSKYEKVVAANNTTGNNRLMGYYERLFADTDNRVNFFKNGRYATTRENKISDYIGGPNSSYGIGRTTIKRTTFTGNKTEIRNSLNLVAAHFSKEGKANIDNDIINYTKKDSSIYKQYNSNYRELNLNNKNSLKNTGSVISGLTLASLGIKLPPILSSFIPSLNPLPGSTESVKFDANNLKKSLNNNKTKINSAPNANNIVLDSGMLGLGAFFKGPTNKPTSTPTSTFYPKPKAKVGGPTTGPDILQIPSPAGVPILLPNPKDLTSAVNTNLTLVTSNKQYNALKTKPTSTNSPSTYQYDTVSKQPEVILTKFKIQPVGNLIDRNDKNFEYLKNALDTVYNRSDENIMSVSFGQLNPFTGEKMTESKFSAYISGYSEDYNSNWTDIKYNGRSEFFYTFNSFKKTASFRLQIPIFNQWELTEKHDALKKLQKSAAGAYLDNRLGGVISEVKLGYYLNYAPCIITNLKITIPNEASWDWGIDNPDGENLAYAMLLEADFSITVIGDEIPGWNLGKTPPPPPVPKPVIPPPKIEPVKMEMPPRPTIELDALSTGTTRNADMFKGTTTATATNAMKLNPKSAALAKSATAKALTKKNKK